MGTGAASAIAIVAGAVAVACAISRIVCYYMGSYTSTLGEWKFRAIDRKGVGPGRGALLILTGIALVNLHAPWPWPHSIDRHGASLILSLVMCGVSLLFMLSYMNVGLGSPFELEVDGFYYGLGTLLLGAGNALVQLSFVWRQSNLSYWGLGVAILGLLAAALAIAEDWSEHEVLFRWRMSRLR